MSWSASYGSRHLDGPRKFGPYGSTNRSGNYASVWDSPSPQALGTDRMRMLDMERTRLVERERVRREENVQMEELKKKTIMMEQEKAILLERQKLKRMEEEAERMRMNRQSSGSFSLNKMANRFDAGYQSSLGSARPFGDQLRQASSFNLGSTFEKEKGFQARSRTAMNGHKSRDVWDGHGQKSTFDVVRKKELEVELQKKALDLEMQKANLDFEKRKRELELEMRRIGLPEKRGMPETSYGFSVRSDMPKRPKIQDDWSLPKGGNFRDDSFERSGLRRGNFPNRSNERMNTGFSKDVQKPMFKSPPRSNFSSSAKTDVSMNRRSIRGISNRSTTRNMGSRGDIGGASRRSDKTSSVSRTPVSRAAALTPQLLQNIKAQGRKLMEEGDRKPQQLPLRKVREGARDAGFRGADRSTTGPVRKFQDSRGKKIGEVKRLGSAYNIKKFQGKPLQEEKAPIKSGTGLNASKSTSAKIENVKKVVDAAKLMANKLQKPYYCIYCKVQYNSKKPYRTHLESKKHTDEVTKMEKVHVDNILDINKVAIVKARRSGSNVATKVCATCHQEFTGSFQGHRHSILHTSKMYQLGSSCDLCYQTFRRRSIMDRHLASLKHARNLACSLREEGKFVDSAEELKYPETFDGTSVGMDFIKDVKCARCHVCDLAVVVKNEEVTEHAKAKEHHECFTKYKEKTLAEQKEKEEKLAAERKARQEKLAEERKARQEKLAAERKAREEKREAERKARKEKLEAERKAKAEKVKEGKNTKGETAKAEKKASEVSTTGKIGKDEQGTPEKAETTKKQSEEPTTEKQEEVESVEVASEVTSPTETENQEEAESPEVKSEATSSAATENQEEAESPEVESEATSSAATEKQEEAESPEVKSEATSSTETEKQEKVKSVEVKNKAKPRKTAKKSVSATNI